LVAFGKQQRRQPTSDGAARAGEKYFHAIISRCATSSRTLEPLQGFGDLGRIHSRLRS
jgi:hypothetical protein